MQTSPEETPWRRGECQFFSRWIQNYHSHWKASSESPGVKFSPRCDIEASTDCTARVWDPTFGDCLLTLQGHGADTWGKNSCI